MRHAVKNGVDQTADHRPLSRGAKSHFGLTSGKRITAVCVSFLVGLLILCSTAQAESYSVKDIQFAVNVGPGGSLSCTIDANLYQPVDATASTPAPAILITNPFLGTKATDDGLAADFASDGYVVLSYTGLGWSGSSCPLELDDPAYDGEAASQLVTFLGGGSAATDGTRINDVIQDSVASNGQHYANDPRVGMVGISYGAEADFSAAGVDPRIDTIIPIATWNDLSYSLAPNDADLSGASVSSTTPGTAKTEWANEVFAGGGGVGTVDGVTSGSGSALSGCLHFNPGVCSLAVDLEANGFPDPTDVAFVRHASVESYINQINVPTMLVQGEDDTLFTLKEEIATYTALQARHIPVRMVWQSWGHSDMTPARGELGTNSAGDLDLNNPDGTLSVEGNLIMGWLNYYLRHTGPAPALNFSFFEPWVHYAGEDAAAAYGSGPSYPIGTGVPMYLSGTSGLVGTSSAVTAGTASFITPPLGVPASVTEISGVSQSVPLLDLPGTYAKWESAPLSAAETVVGSPTLHIRVSAPLAAENPGGDLVVFAKLEDIAPDGTATLPDRLIAPARFPANGGDVTIDLPAIAHWFPAGDRIALIVAGSDAAYRSDPVPTPVMIPTTTSDPGVLTLPIVDSTSYSPLVYTAPAAKAGCPKPSGRLAGNKLGPFSLGIARAHARKISKSSIRGQANTDFYCLAQGGIRIGYPSAHLLSTLGASARHKDAGHAVLILTSNRHYAIDGVHASARITAAARTLRTGAPYRIGLNVWYLAANGTTTAVLKVRNGVIDEIGIANRSLTTTRAIARRFLASFG